MLRPVACALVHCARSGQAWQVGGFSAWPAGWKPIDLAPFKFVHDLLMLGSSHVHY